MKADLIIKAACVVTCDENRKEHIFRNGGYVAVKDGLILDVGEENPSASLIDEKTVILDRPFETLTPGLIDSHTHLIHGGSRENELPMKLKGVSYLEILKQGGGILSTVRNTRNWSKEKLKEKARKSLDQMLLHGTTTIEAKSGYGLDLETEIKCLEASSELNCEHSVDIISTYMGAHAIPEEYEGDTPGYIEFITKEVMPVVKERNLAEFMDVFCEHGVFSPEESEQLFLAGKEMGFKLKIHADEIIPLQGAELAAKLGAVSADHLLATSDEGIEMMAKAGVTATVLPGTSFYLMTGKFARAREMMNAGIRVAIATDYNPGSSPTENLQAVMTFACFGMKLTPEEIIKGMTLNGAYAIGKQNEIGSLEKGKKADMVLFNSGNPEYIVYHYGINHVNTVIKCGKIVVDRGQLLI